MNDVNRRGPLGLSYLRLVRDYRANPWFRKEIFAERCGCSVSHIVSMLKRAVKEERVERVISEVELKHRIIYNYRLDNPSVLKASMVTILGYDSQMITRAINDGISNNWEHIPQLTHYYDKDIRNVQSRGNIPGSNVRSTDQCDRSQGKNCSSYR